MGFEPVLVSWPPLRLALIEPVPSTPEGLRLLAQSLLGSDRAALGVTGSCWEVARILEPHVQRVLVVSPDDTGISSVRAKTDKLDAQTLAGLLWKGELDAVWMPDERCQVLRRPDAPAPIARRAPRPLLLGGRTRSEVARNVYAHRPRKHAAEFCAHSVLVGAVTHPCG